MDDLELLVSDALKRLEEWAEILERRVKTNPVLCRQYHDRIVGAALILMPMLDVLDRCGKGMQPRVDKLLNRVDEAIGKKVRL